MMNLDDPKLTAYALDEFDALDAAGRAEVEAWLATSAEGRQFVTETRQMAALLSEKLHTTSAPALTDEQREAILGINEAVTGKGGSTTASENGARKDIAPGAPSKIRKVSFVTALTALAACLLAGAFLPWTEILGLRHEKGSNVATVASTENKESLDAFQLTIGATPAPALASQQAPSSSNEIDARDMRLAPNAPAASAQLALAEKRVDTAGVKQQDASQPAEIADFQSAAKPTSAPMIAGKARSSSGNQAAKESEELQPMRAQMQQMMAQAKVVDESEKSEGVRRASVDKDFNTEAYDAQEENPFLDVKGNPLSTFSIDVDTASYANVRRFISHGQLPPKGSVRIEEMLNYFSYDYPAPTDNTPFSTSIEAAECPWQPEHRLVRIGLRGRDVPSAERPTGNLVFLIDVSGSMEPANKLPLLRQSLRLLADQLGENDRVAIAVYAGNSGLVLPSTSDKRAIKDALDRLEAGGSTNGAAGIQLAYDEATKNFIKGGINRVILATDGDFNVGITNQSDLVALIQKKAKTGVFLSVLGFGEGNLKDSTMEKLADKGNGNYAYIDTIQEGRKVLVEQLGGTLVTIAKDVKIQVEFNPAVVAQYRLIGYENRILAKEDFNDDTKDAGEIGANHTVTALYELVPAGKSVPTSTVDPLKYQPAPDANPQSEAPGKSAGRTEVTGQRSVLPNSQPDEQRSTAESKIENPKPKMSELLTVKLRYKQPDSEVSTRVEFPFTDPGAKLTSATPDFRFAAAVAEAGLLLKDSAHKQLASWNSAIELASKSIGDLRNKKQDRYREEFVALARRARDLSHHSEE